VNYVVEWTEKGFILEVSRLDSKGRWEFDPDKRKTYSLGTDLPIVIQDILNDLSTYIK